jgi:hypothetical protein
MDGACCGFLRRWGEREGGRKVGVWRGEGG